MTAAAIQTRGARATGSGGWYEHPVRRSPHRVAVRIAGLEAASEVVVLRAFLDDEDAAFEVFAGLP